MTKKILIFAIIFSILTLSSCDAAQSETPTDTTNSGSESETVSVSESETKKDTDGEIKTNEFGIPEYPSDRFTFTMELIETVYTTSSDRIIYRIRSKEPAESISLGEKWKLYRIEGNESDLIGERMGEIAVEISANDGEDYVDRERTMIFKALCGKNTLEAGRYCLMYYEDYPTESGIAMYFEVIE